MKQWKIFSQLENTFVNINWSFYRFNLVSGLNFRCWAKFVCFFTCDKFVCLIIGNNLAEQNNLCIVHAPLSEFKLPLKHIYLLKSSSYDWHERWFTWYCDRPYCVTVVLNLLQNIIHQDGLLDSSVTLALCFTEREKGSFWHLIDRFANTNDHSLINVIALVCQD